ncbi:lactonase family protein [Bifidobacterium aquikefiricola]|uniref:Beta-propeller fold lactonase family protein n=1 Tax=Bifidobacterium aquikefiricola TaxID=3059038 RepID=A0AB39U7C5_9BIFI
MGTALGASADDGTRELLVGGWGKDGDGQAQGIEWITASHESAGSQAYGNSDEEGIQLEHRRCVAEIPSPSWMCLNDGIVYGCLEFSNELVSYSCTRHSDQRRSELQLHQLSRMRTPGEGPTHVALCRDDRGAMHIVSACYGDGTVTVHPIDAKGRIGEAEQALHGAGHGPLPAQEHSHAHWILPIESSSQDSDSDPSSCSTSCTASSTASSTIEEDAASPRAGSSPSARHLVLVADLGADRIRTYMWRNGMLNKLGALYLPAGTGPRDLHILPANLQDFGASAAILLITEWSRKAFVLRLDPSNPAGISIVDSVNLGATQKDQASSLAYIPDDASSPERGFAYVGLRGTNRIIPLRWNGCTLARLPHAGDGSWQNGFSSGGSWPRHVLAFGRRLLVSNQLSSTVNCFVCDDDGRPHEEASLHIPSPTCTLIV